MIWVDSYRGEPDPCRHEFTEEQIWQHDPFHMEGHSTIRVANVQHFNNDFTGGFHPDGSSWETQYTAVIYASLNNFGHIITSEGAL
jgi:hypothetical protein